MLRRLLLAPAGMLPGRPTDRPSSSPSDPPRPRARTDRAGVGAPGRGEAIRLVSCWVLSVAVVLGVAGCAPQSSEDPSAGDTAGTEESPPTSEEAASVQVAVEVKDGEARGDVQRVDVPVGGTVDLRVTSDVGDTVHVHGYDLEKQVDAGQPASVAFTADIPGQFEVELEDRGLKLAEIRVGG